MRCKFCGGKVKEHSRKDEWHPIDYVRCEDCYAQQRHWLIWDVFNHLKPHVGTMLHISPDKCLERKFKPLADEYITTDHPIRETKGIIKADIDADLIDMPFEDNKFDFIVLSHVLDQVKDEDKARSELRRILKPNGTILLVVPIYPAERTKELDEPYANHWRRCGTDYEDRFKEFKFQKFTYEETVFALT